MSTTYLRTPTAHNLLVDLRKERDRWDEMSREDTLNTFTRHGATSRRDQLDFVIQRLSRDLRDVEREAVEVEISESTRLDAVLDAYEGVPV